MAPDCPLTREQFIAARMLIARLRSEASFEPFVFEDLGIEWLSPDDVVCATTDVGDQLSFGDIFYAAIVMIWSLVMSQAQESGVHPLAIVSDLGLGLAQHEPT